MTGTLQRAAEPTHRALQTAGLTAAFGIGLLVALQSRVNGELGLRLGDGIAAALISFGSGLLILLVACALIPGIRRGLARVWSTVRAPVDPVAGTARPVLRWWQCIGGLAGAFLVTSQSITVSVLGVAAFTVAGVAGQTGSALLVDRFGIGPAGKQRLTASRVLGAVIALAAVLLTVSGRLGDGSVLWLAVLPLLAGVGSAVQQGFNGRVARVASPDGYGAVSAAVINFVVGTAALALVFVVDLIVRGAPQPPPTEPWLYVGGACGVAFITLAAATVRVVGVFVLGLGTIAGQLIGSLIIDIAVPAVTDAVTGTVLAGTALALVAVVIGAAAGWRRD